MKHYLYTILFYFFCSNLIIGQGVDVELCCEIKIIKTGNKFLIKNSNSKTLVKNVDSIGIYESTRFIVLKKGGKYGMYDKFGEHLIPVSFDKISKLDFKYWLVEKKKKVGIFNVYNSTYTGTTFDSVALIEKLENKFVVKKNNKIGIIDNNFNEIAVAKYDSFQFIKGTGVLVLNNKKSFLIGNKIIEEDILIDKKFWTNKQYYIFKKEDKLGLLDKSGNLVFKTLYDEIECHNYYPDSKLDYILFVKDKDKWGAVNFKNEIKVPIKFESIEFAIGSEHLIVDQNNLKYFYNLKSKQLLPHSFEKFVSLPYFSRLEKNKKQTLINNTTFELVLPFKYEEIYYHKKADLYVVKLNNKYGVITLEDEIVIPIIYDHLTVWPCSEIKYVVEKNKKHGVIDNNNNIVFPFQGNTIFAYNDNIEIKSNSNQSENFDCLLNKINK